MAGGSRLQVNCLTAISRRPASRRSPSLRETRATLWPSRPPQAKQFACSFVDSSRKCSAVRRIHFALRRIPIREGFSVASLRAERLRGGQSPLLWKAGGQKVVPKNGWRISPTSKLPDGNFSQARLAALAFASRNSRNAVAFSSAAGKAVCLLLRRF